jgi:DNA-directed RNA polymerase subunit RPC12/RpoP
MVSLSRLPQAARCPNEQAKNPYVICSPCGVQMFIRERAGIEAFGKLVEQGLKADLLTRIGQLEQRYRLHCPECGKSFWASPELLGRNWFNSKLSGYRCPESNCQGIVPVGERSDARRDTASNEKPEKPKED